MYDELYLKKKDIDLVVTLTSTAGQKFEGFLIRVQRNQENTDQEQCVGNSWDLFHLRYGHTTITPTNPES